MSTAIVFGANGISGLALLERLSATSDQEWKKIIAISRRPPVLDHEDPRITFKAVDLLGSADELVSRLKDAGAMEATHIFFYAYVAKQDEQELIDINRSLFSNSLNAVAAVCPKLKVFLLQTGYKYYGVHKGGNYLAKAPFKEDAPRHEGDNFYYHQEDMLIKGAKEHGWSSIIVRPNFVIGASKGNFMSLATTLALYAAGRKFLEEPLIFPGSEATYHLPYDHSCAINSADFQIFASQNDKAHNRVFNISDGRTAAWAELWPKVAEYFSLPLASPVADKADAATGSIGAIPVTPHPSGAWATSHTSDFDALVSQKSLSPEAYKYATWEFLDFATSRTWADIGSMDEAKSLGWERTLDPWIGYRDVFDKLKKEGVIPV